MSPQPWRVVTLGSAFAVGSITLACAEGFTERVSVRTGGGQVNMSSSTPALSASGRFVGFSSAAPRLVPGDTNRKRDVFVRDRQTGVTERVSVGTGGVQGNDESADPALSANGRWVTFWSLASNLVSGDTNGVLDHFVRDRGSGTTERVSVGPAGVQGKGPAFLPGGRWISAISANGRYVAFHSNMTNLVASDTNGQFDIFVRDRSSGRTERVSTGRNGIEADGGSFSPAISANGRFVAFTSVATNLVPGDANEAPDVFVHDRTLGRTELVSVGPADDLGDNFSNVGGISASGRFVAFLSYNSKLVPGDTNLQEDVFVRDRATGTTERVSVGSDGAQGDNGSRGPAISADGQVVAFVSFATNLVPDDTNSLPDVFVHDRQRGVTKRASVGLDGSVQSNGFSDDPAISADGRVVGLHSQASNLVTGDTNRVRDVFVRRH